MQKLSMTPQEVENLAGMVIAAHGAETWWRVSYVGHDLVVPDDLFDMVSSFDRADARPRLKAYAADKRWRVETGGIAVAGVRVPTDDRAKLLLFGASSGMADEDTAEFLSGGVSATLTGAQFKAFYGALNAHVRACFAVQSAVMADIDAGTITTVAQIDGAEWPPNA